MSKLETLKSVAKERLVADQSASELAPLLSVNERALVSILATAEIYQLDAKKLVAGFARETTSLTEFASRLNGSDNTLDALGNAVSLPCKVALHSSRASGSLIAFYKSWLAQTVDDRIRWVRHEDTNAAKLTRLFFRTMISLWLFVTILMSVIPEHQKMLEEFGIEPNSAFSRMITVGSWFLVLSPILFLGLFFLFLYVVIFQRSLLWTYIRRWLPGRWRQTVLPLPIQTRKLLAWDLLAFRGNQQTPPVVDWNQLVTSRALAPAEAKIFQETTSRETQAWLLRNMADQKQGKQRDRLSLVIGLASLLIQLVVGILIVLIAFAMFTMMIDIMNNLAVG